MSGLHSLMREAKREARKGQEKQRQLENRAIKAAVAARQRKQTARHEGYAADIIKQREANKPTEAALSWSKEKWRKEAPQRDMLLAAQLEQAKRGGRTANPTSVKRNVYNTEGAVTGQEFGTFDPSTGQHSWGSAPQGGMAVSSRPSGAAPSWKQYSTPPQGGPTMTVGGRNPQPLIPGQGGGAPVAPAPAPTKNIFNKNMLGGRTPQINPSQMMNLNAMSPEKRQAAIAALPPEEQVKIRKATAFTGQQW